MAIWDDYLHEAKFDGIEFPVSSRRMTGGRALARRRYQNRPGQSIEDTGREPYSFELEVPLFAGIDPELYPSRWDTLRLALDDTTTTGEAEYVDVELGPLNAKVIAWEWLETADKRDGGVLTLQLEEVTFDDVLFRVDTEGDPQRTAESNAETLDAELSDLGLDEAELEDEFAAAGVPLTVDEKDKQSGELWSTQVARFAEGIEDGVRSAESLADSVDALRTRINVLTAKSSMQAPGAVHAMHATARLTDALTAMAAQAARDVPPLVEHVTKTKLSVYDIASELYGSPDRAEEILARNPTATPLMVPAGTRLVLLAA